MDILDISGQLGQIREVLERFAERITAIEEAEQQQYFTVQQLLPILAGTRVDIVAMRATLLRIEQVLHAPVAARSVNAPAQIEEKKLPDDG